jgi:hypothetical protein
MRKRKLAVMDEEELRAMCWRLELKVRRLKRELKLLSEEKVKAGVKITSGRLTSQHE